MAGVSTPAFMRIAEDMGAGLVYTELISSEAIIRNNKKTFDMLKGIEKIKIPLAIQLFGADADTLAESAKILMSKYDFDILDINMGCPVPKVAIRSEAGSALLKDPQKIYEIVKKVSSSIPIPVTVKIRSGWDEKHINAKEIAVLCEKAGAKAIAIHARTRAQGYTGLANWDVIKEVKESVSIPVIGNGDVTTPELFKKMKDETGCDAVMIGRGILGNPWLIKETVEFIKHGQVETIPTFKMKIDMIKKHYELLLEDKPEKLALLEIRSHALWYLKGLKGNAEIKNKICSSKSSDELFSILEEYSHTCS